MDKTMADKLMYIPNDDTRNFPFCRLKLVVETFGHSTLSTNQSKFNKNFNVVEPTNCYFNITLTTKANKQAHVPSLSD